MESEEATPDNDLTQTSTPTDTDKSNPGTGAPARDAEPAPSDGAASRPQPETVSSTSPTEEPTLGHTPVSTVDPDGTTGSGGNGASGPVIPPDPAAQADDFSGNEDLLLPADQRELFTAQWSDIQAHFVDQPRHSVEQADALVVDIMQRVTVGFSHERERLESQWEQGDDVSTEDLRLALTRYRSFFDRLIST